MTAFYLKPKFLFSVGGAALAMTGLNMGKVLSPIRPALVGGLKEGYIFKDWFAGKLETSKEDLEDLVAEAKYAYEQSVALTSESIEREKQLLENVDKVMQKRKKIAGPAKKKSKTS